MMRPYRTYRAFTLVELLVVVTIIIILLSLLVPAVNKSIYIARLASCAAGNLKVMALGVTQYAFDNARNYPDRGMDRYGYQDTGGLPLNPQTVKRATREYDMRPLHKTIFPINATMQCPLSPTVELENDDINQGENLDASYAMYWAWHYKNANPSDPYAGMWQLGDVFEYDDLLSGGTQRVSFRVLAGDIDLAWNTGAQASHPDRDPSRMYPITINGEFFIDGRIVVARWALPGHERGVLDLNYAFDDGSVHRYDGVTRVDLPANHKQRDHRMARVPINFDNYNNRGTNIDKMHIPRQ